MEVPFSKRLQFFINEYTFEEEPTPPREIKYEELPQEELADVCRELRTKVKKYERHLEEELHAKLKQARYLIMLEMHLEALDPEGDDHHQNISLEHAITWLGKYGPEDGEGLLTDVNEIHRKILSKRIRAVRKATADCNRRPACKHVLEARPPLAQPGENLEFTQVALGFPIQVFLETLPPDVLADNKRLWRRTDGTILHYVKDDERIPREEVDKMNFLTQYFRGQTTDAFIHTRATLIDNLVRDGHRKKELKVCKEVPKSNIRKTINVIRKAMGDEDMETVSPTKSVMSSMAVGRRPIVPGSGQLPRHKHVSMVKLYENPEASAGQPMSDALNRGSKTLSSAGASVDRVKRQRTSGEPKKGVSFQSPPELEKISENEILSPQPKPLPVRRERIHRDSGESANEPAKKEKSVPSWAAGTSSSHARKASGLSRNREESPARPSGRRAQSPLVPQPSKTTETPESGRKSTKSAASSSSASPSAHRLHLSAKATPSTGRTHRTATTPGTTPQVERARSSTIGTTGSSKPSPPVSRVTVWPGPKAPEKTKAREDKSRDDKEKARSDRHRSRGDREKEREDRRKATEIIDKEREERRKAREERHKIRVDREKPREDKGKGKAKEEKPLPPIVNPFVSETPAGLLSDWKRTPSEIPPSGKTSSSKQSQATPTPAPRPTSSVYSFHPPPPPESKFSRVTKRNREAREDIVEEPEPITPPKAPARAPTIPAGVDPGNVAGGLGHGFNPSHIRGGSTSTLGTIPPGVDLDTAGGTASRYVPPRANWDAAKNPKGFTTEAKEPRKRYHFPAGPLGPMLERTPPPGGWASDDNTENEEEEKKRHAAESRRGRPIVHEPGRPRRVPVSTSVASTASGESPREKAPFQPRSLKPSGSTLTESDKRAGATLHAVSSQKAEVYHPEPTAPQFAEAQSAVVEGGDEDDSDEWSSRIGLPTTPTATALSPAARAFHSPEKKLKRGRNNMPRGNESLSVPADRRVHGGSRSRSGSSRSASRSTDRERERETPVQRVELPSPITEELPASAFEEGLPPVSPLSPSLVPTPLTNLRGKQFRSHIGSILTEIGDENDFTVKLPTPPPKDTPPGAGTNPSLLPYEQAHSQRQPDADLLSEISSHPFPPKNWALHPKPEPETYDRQRERGQRIAETKARAQAKREAEEQEEDYSQAEPFWEDDPPEKLDEWRRREDKRMERKEREQRERWRREIEEERKEIAEREREKRESMATDATGTTEGSAFFDHAIRKVQRGEW